MIKTGRRTVASRRARKPSWIRDPQDQKKWNDQFIKILKTGHLKSDALISAILGNERLSQMCATKIRSYVDKNFTTWWYAESKARGIKVKEKLELAIGGLRAAIQLCRIRGDRESASSLGMLGDEYSLALGRCKQAFATKPHGRDRDQSVLLECLTFLQKGLGQPITYALLAYLVNAGEEAEGCDFKEFITEEQIRKNLTNFERNNPHSYLYANKVPPA